MRRKQFYVVQFMILPFDDIDKYICVPHSWVTPFKSGEKASVAYPDNEDPLTIRDRVRNKEKPNDEWLFYVAFIKYASASFEDAENWIENQNDDKACKTNKDPPKLLPKIKIKIPTQLKLKKGLGVPQVKLKVSPQPVRGVIDYPHTVTKDIKEKQLIVVIDNQLVQSAQTVIAAALDNNTSSVQSLPDFTKREKSVMSDQSASSSLPHKSQPLPASQTGKQVLDTESDEVKRDINIADHVHMERSKEKAEFPNKTCANSPKQVPESDSVDEKSTPLVHHKHSLPELSLQDKPAEQSKETDVYTRTELLQILSTPITVTRPSKTPNQRSQGKYSESALLPPSSATHQYPQLKGTNGSSSTEVTNDHQRQHSQGFINNTSSLPHNSTNLMNPPTKLLHPSIKKKSSSATENLVAKRMCRKNITKNTLITQKPSSSTARFYLFDNSLVQQAPQVAEKHQKEVSRQPISNAGGKFRDNPLNLSNSPQGITTSAAQNLSYLAQHVERTDIQHYLLMQKHYSEQIARSNSKFEHPNIGHRTDRHANFAGGMNSEFTLQSKPNSFSQTNQFLSQHNQYGLLNEDSIQDVRATPLLQIHGAHTNSATITQNFEGIIQFPAQNSLIQSHYNFENRHQRQDPPRYQELPGRSLISKAGPQKTERQGVIKRTPSPVLPDCLSQPLWNAQRDYSYRDPCVWVSQSQSESNLNQNLTEHQILHPVVSGNLVNEAEPTTMNAEVQTAPLTDPLDKTPSEIGIIYINPRTKKLVVDQATETDPVVDTDAAKSSDESAPQVADSRCQTDGCFVEEQDLPYQDTDSDSEISGHGVDSDRGEYEDHSRTDAAKAHEKNPQMQQRSAKEQEMMAIMSANYDKTQELFTDLRNSIAEGYELLLETVLKLNETGRVPVEETSRPSKNNISEDSSAKNITGTSSAPKMNSSRRNTLILPPEYDPNKPEWTRKYQEKGPGLVELLPRTNIYVSEKGLSNCKRESTDCRSLARMLLTEVFSRNALSVCSLTGGKPKAFSNHDVRPGLDEYARMILLTFVERYGARRGWTTDDTAGIFSSIRTKIYQMRAEYGQVGKG